jgi:triacylglycerol esterase/lipase EstA (alpha/beta hydrolase family)
MRLRAPLLCTAIVLSAAGMIVPGGAAAAPARGPALQETTEALARTLTCPATFQGRHEPVLLVHGTGQTGESTFSRNYLQVLPRMGYDVCTVGLVDYGRGDIQASAERIVYAIRIMAERSHSRVQVIGHSEGPLPVRWAIKWWPDVAPLVDDLVGIAPPYHGWLGTDVLCGAGCVPALWQMRRESKFMAASNSGDETPGGVSYTTVYSMTDELVQPYSTADLKGGTNIKVQEVCPGRIDEHFQMVFDAVVYAVVLDALTHSGPAAMSRLDRSVCRQLAMPGITTVDPVLGEVDAWTFSGLLAPSERHVDREPPVAAYARS